MTKDYLDTIAEINFLFKLKDNFTVLSTGFIKQCNTNQLLSVKHITCGVSC